MTKMGGGGGLVKALPMIYMVVPGRGGESDMLIRMFRVKKDHRYIQKIPDNQK